jgi:hypothetical protein
VARAAAVRLVAPLKEGLRRAILIAEIDGRPPAEHPFGEFLREQGFVPTSMGFQLRAAGLAHA